MQKLCTNQKPKRRFNFFIALYFTILLFLCYIFHSREVVMEDFPSTFDYWWYFYHRLLTGSLAQWNPYILLGKISICWEQTNQLV